MALCRVLQLLAVVLVAVSRVAAVAINRGPALASRPETRAIDDAPELPAGRLFVVETNGSFAVTSNLLPGVKAPAWAEFVHPRERRSNFGQLTVTTNDAYGDDVQMRAAGFIEGYLTAELLYYHYYNMRTWFESRLSNEVDGSGNLIDDVEHWLKKMHKWTDKKSKRRRRGKFWRMARLHMEQLNGLVMGYTVAVEQQGIAPHFPHMKDKEIMLLNGLGDAFDVLHALSSSFGNWSKWNSSQLRSHVARSQHGTACITVAPDLTDIFVGHSSSFPYSSMLRVWKHYHFRISERAWTAKRISFSSYPGMLSSLDDFYITDNKLVVLHTGFPVLDAAAYRRASQRSVPSWMRARIATAAATSGKHWAKMFRKHNPGTYNSQYMVLDLKRFRPGVKLEHGLLTVVEQMPGVVAWTDHTSALAMGYWPSYNVPSMRSTYRAGGYHKFMQSQQIRGEDFAKVANLASYDLAPKAKILRRDHGQAVSLDTMKSLMQYSDWRNDEFSDQDSLSTICPRGDLSEHPLAVGCTDTKVTSFKLAVDLQAEAIAAPTTRDVPAFNWSLPAVQQLPHHGHPEVFDFEFEVQKPPNTTRPQLQAH